MQVCSFLCPPKWACLVYACSYNLEAWSHGQHFTFPPWQWVPIGETHIAFQGKALGKAAGHLRVLCDLCGPEIYTSWTIPYKHMLALVFVAAKGTEKSHKEPGLGIAWAQQNQRVCLRHSLVPCTASSMSLVLVCKREFTWGCGKICIFPSWGLMHSWWQFQWSLVRSQVPAQNRVAQ